MSCVGNDNIHLMTSRVRQHLIIATENWYGTAIWAMYDNFVVGSEQEKYILRSVGTYTGSMGQYSTGTITFLRNISLSVTKHVYLLSKFCYFHVQELCSIRPYRYFIAASIIANSHLHTGSYCSINSVRQTFL